ncbi:MAG: hypothetical protein ACRD3R_09745, partial [Terriglobales bacterium]
MRRAALLGLVLLAAEMFANTAPHLEIPRIARPPRLEDFEGMQPAPEVAGQMVKVTGFLQRVPQDGAP